MTPRDLRPYVKLYDETRVACLAAGGPSALAVWAAYAQVSGIHERWVYLSEASMAKRAGVSIATLKRLLARLEDAGLVEIDDAPGRTHWVRTTADGTGIPRANLAHHELGPSSSRATHLAHGELGPHLRDKNDEQETITRGIQIGFDETGARRKEPDPEEHARWFEAERRRLAEEHR